MLRDIAQICGNYILTAQVKKKAFALYGRLKSNRGEASDEKGSEADKDLCRKTERIKAGNRAAAYTLRESDRHLVNGGSG